MVIEKSYERFEEKKAGASRDTAPDSVKTEWKNCTEQTGSVGESASSLDPSENPRFTHGESTKKRGMLRV
jgi:hypothetical protein